MTRPVGRSGRGAVDAGCGEEFPAPGILWVLFFPKGALSCGDGTSRNAAAKSALITATTGTVVTAEQVAYI